MKIVDITTDHQMKKLYYAHSMLTYNTRKEKRELKQIRKQFPNHNIINPAEIEFTGNGSEKMQAYLELVKQVDIIVISSYRKHIGKGVALELEMATKNSTERYFLQGKRFIDNFTSKINDPYDWKIQYAKIIEHKTDNPEKGMG